MAGSRIKGITVEIGGDTTGLDKALKCVLGALNAPFVKRGLQKTSWCSDGKYTRDEETTCTFRGDESGVRIEEHYQYHDDDGQSGSRDRVYSTGRDILNVLGKVFKE